MKPENLQNIITAINTISELKVSTNADMNQFNLALAISLAKEVKEEIAQ